jgi:hypothetical protein
MRNMTERDIIELATRLWVHHRRHEEGRRPPTNEELGLTLYWTGSSWYASVTRWPPRTPRRSTGVYASTASGALDDLLRKLRTEG